MTIKELYEWAVQKGIENLPYLCDYGEGLTEPEDPYYDDHIEKILL